VNFGGCIKTHLELTLKKIPRIIDMNETVPVQKELLEKIKEKMESIGKQIERLES
jgi:hypothetical protein